MQLNAIQEVVQAGKALVVYLRSDVSLILIFQIIKDG